MSLITAKVFPKWKEIRWYWNSRILLVNTGWRAAERSPWLLYSYSKLCMKSATQSHFKIQTMNQKKSFWRQIKQLANSNFSVFCVFADSSRTIFKPQLFIPFSFPGRRQPSVFPSLLSSVLQPLSSHYSSLLQRRGVGCICKSVQQPEQRLLKCRFRIPGSGAQRIYLITII